MLSKEEKNEIEEIVKLLDSVENSKPYSRKHSKPNKEVKTRISTIAKRIKNNLCVLTEGSLNVLVERYPDIIEKPDYIALCEAAQITPTYDFLKQQDMNLNSSQLIKLFKNSECTDERWEEIEIFHKKRDISGGDYKKLGKLYNKSQKSGESLSQKIITYSRQDKKDKVKEKQDKPPIKKHYGTKILLDTLIGSLAILGFIKCCFMIQDEEQKVREYENTLRTRTVAESTYVPTNEVQEILNEFTPKKSLEDDIKHQNNQSESLKKYDIKRGDHLTRVAKMVLKAGGNADESNSTINNMIYRIMGINGIKATADNDHLKKGPNGNVVPGHDSLPDRKIWNVGDTILLPNYNKTKGFITSQLEKVKQDPLKKFDCAQINADKKLENIAANSTSPEKKPKGLLDINNIIRGMYVKNHYLKTIKKEVKKYVNDDVPEKVLENRIINTIESGSKITNLRRNTFNTEIAKLSGDYSTIKDKLANGETYFNIKEYTAKNAKARMNISDSTIYKIKKELKEERSLIAA